MSLANESILFPFSLLKPNSKFVLKPGHIITTLRPVKPPAELSVRLMSPAKSSSLHWMDAPVKKGHTWTTVANVCLLLSALVTTKDLPFHLEKWFMTMASCGERLEINIVVERGKSRKPWNKIIVFNLACELTVQDHKCFRKVTSSTRTNKTSNLVLLFYCTSYTELNF